MKKMTAEEMRKENGGCHTAILYLGERRGFSLRWGITRILRWRGQCGCTFEIEMDA